MDWIACLRQEGLVSMNRSHKESQYSKMKIMLRLGGFWQYSPPLNLNMKVYNWSFCCQCATTCNPKVKPIPWRELSKSGRNTGSCLSSKRPYLKPILSLKFLINRTNKLLFCLYPFGFGFLSVVSEIPWYKYTINKRREKQMLGIPPSNTRIHRHIHTHSH